MNCRKEVYSDGIYLIRLCECFIYDSGFLHELHKQKIPFLILDFQGEYISSGLTNSNGETFIDVTNAIEFDPSKIGILVSLSVAMFLTPCVEIEAYYFQAGLNGWKGIFIVSAVYTSATLLLMLLFVYAGFKGTKKLRSHTLEHHEKLITGIVLIGLGILAFFVKL